MRGYALRWQKGRRIWYRQLHGMGGRQKALREEVLARFPLYYERYIEVFGGGGWVLFHKPPGTDFEVYNDLNGNLAALYRAVRDHPQGAAGAASVCPQFTGGFHAPQAGAGASGGDGGSGACCGVLPGHPVQLRGRLRQLCGAAAQHVGNFPSSIKPAHGCRRSLWRIRILRSSSGSMTDR